MFLKENFIFLSRVKNNVPTDAELAVMQALEVAMHVRIPSAWKQSWKTCSKAHMIACVSEERMR